MPCSGTQTPYPQNRQQTLGATSAALWKTASNLHIPRVPAIFLGFSGNLINKQPDDGKPLFIRPVADSKHLIHRSANRLWGQVRTPLQPYPHKKAPKNRDLAWLFFVQRHAGVDLRGLWRPTNILSTATLTAFVGKPITCTKNTQHLHSLLQSIPWPGLTRKSLAA